MGEFAHETQVEQKVKEVSMARRLKRLTPEQRATVIARENIKI